jgi:hypothetical protein
MHSLESCDITQRLPWSPQEMVWHGLFTSAFDNLFLSFKTNQNAPDYFPGIGISICFYPGRCPS